MRNSNLYKAYDWMIATIYNSGGLTFNEINARWMKTEFSEGKPLSRTTFRRYRHDIEDLFSIRIICRANLDNKYYIDRKSPGFFSTPQQWLASSFSMNNVLARNIDMSERIQLEVIPSDNETLDRIIEAMRKSATLRIIYQKYDGEEQKEHLIEPYCVKLFLRRWYVLAIDEGIFKMFSLDRIKQLEITEQSFKIDPKFNTETYFAERFGVFLGSDMKLERVVLRAYGTQVKYFRDLPVNVSQKEINTCDDYSDFEYQVYPTIDFSNFILGWGNRVKVLEPEWYAEEIKKLAQETAELYDK